MTQLSATGATPEQDAQAIGVVFEAFSHWPLCWHPILMRALRRAHKLKIHRVYIKKKFGELRIQSPGNHKKIFKISEMARNEASRVCFNCGAACEPPKMPEMPRCSCCEKISLQAIPRVMPGGVAPY